MSVRSIPKFDYSQEVVKCAHCEKPIPEDRVTWPWIKYCSKICKKRARTTREFREELIAISKGVGKEE